MDGTAEIERLAELLRVGAGVARRIADARSVDADELRRLADEAERMATDLETMTRRDVPDGGTPPAASSGDTLQ